MTDTAGFKVSLTADDVLHCIRIRTVEGFALLVHTASAVDLHHKLSMALCDWNLRTAAALGMSQAERNVSADLAERFGTDQDCDLEVSLAERWDSLLVDVGSTKFEVSLRVALDLQAQLGTVISRWSRDAVAMQSAELRKRGGNW